MHRTLSALAAVLTLPALVTAAPEPRLDPVTEWSVTASTLGGSTGMAPLRVPITLALLHVAMYDAVAAVEGGREMPVELRGTAARPASSRAAAVEAGHRIALAEFPSASSAIEAVYARLCDAEADSPARTNGLAVGAAVARALLRERAHDGRDASAAYTPLAAPGAWVPTPPDFLAEHTAFLARVTPFAIDSPSHLRPKGPPALDSTRWADDYNEVRRRGAKNSVERTAEETATAWFWEPLAGTVWPATIHRLAADERLSLAQSAKFQAAAFVAFADSLIACWDAKYHYSFWRPVTAIRQGDTDRNSGTDPDPNWEPLGVTPNFPEYASGHTCATAAVADTIERFFEGRVAIPARNVVTGEERVFRSAAAVIDEVVEARLLLGVHFRSADEDGAEIGHRVAALVGRRFFK
ncbi:MAG: vanadium-dependent haloperoxidase [Vicinamibacterales bacterium]